MNIKPFDFSFSLVNGTYNTAYNFKGARINSMGLSNSNDVEILSPFGSGIVFKPQRMIEVEMSFTVEDYSMEYFQNFRPLKISKKKVEDCSINELLFAIRQKIKQK